MDDLLSVAICEAGLEEFLLASGELSSETEKDGAVPAADTACTVEGQKAVDVVDSGGSSTLESEEGKREVEVLSDGSVTLPSCSHTDSEGNSRSVTPHADDPVPASAPALAPTSSIACGDMQQLVEVVENGELPSDLAFADLTQGICGAASGGAVASSAGRVFRLRGPTAAAAGTAQHSLRSVQVS